MSNTFDQVHLPNLGFGNGKIPITILQSLNQEIEDIHTNDQGILRMNQFLAGHIAQEYQITKSRQLLDSFLEEMAIAYQKEWHYYEEKDLKVESVWVNMQKKQEVNPLHNHDGILSFVAWLNLPFKLEDEMNMPNCENSRTVHSASTFQFVYTNVLGTIKNVPLFVESGWEGTIVMFPSKLMHIVYPFQTSDDYRISIAGNLY